MEYSWSGLTETLLSGVDFSLPGNGGPACRDYLSLVQRTVETALVCLISALLMGWGLQRLNPPIAISFIRRDRGGRRLLLVLISLVFGAEVAFKFASRQLIYLLNPCHITTIVQIVLLSLPPSVLSTVLFRIHLGFLNGAVLALVFPVTNTLLLPFESELFYIQHTMMLVVPYYLLRLGGVYNIEPLWDLSWTLIALAIQMLYNFLILQTVSLWSMANLNSLLCPAISDPFSGRWYRCAAFLHQSLFIPLCCKLYCLTCNFFITQFGPTAIKDSLSADVTEATRPVQAVHTCSACGQTVSTTNGRSHSSQMTQATSMSASPDDCDDDDDSVVLRRHLTVAKDS